MARQASSGSSTMTLDDSHRMCQKVLELLGTCSSKASLDDENAKAPVFNPELVTAHCFQPFKRKDFHLPPSRRRIIVVSREQVPALPPQPPAPPPPPVSSFKGLEAGDMEKQPVDRKAWLSQRAKLRMELESFGNVQGWLENKPSVTPSEAKVLRRIQEEQKGPVVDVLSVMATKKKAPQGSRRLVPQLRLPKPTALLTLYSYLRSHRIKILEVFNKSERGENQRISREEFILALKATGIPLKNQEMEDIVIYLGSLGKQNAITTDVLANTYKRWSLTQQRSALPTAREYYILAKQKAASKSPLPTPKVDLTSQAPKMDLLTVPEVDTQTEWRPMTLEEMEDVGKRYRERRRCSKQSLPSIQFTECCRLVRCGEKPFDEHCLPSTISGEMEDIVNKARRDDFLIYLQCWEICQAYGLPLTKDILMRALLYPGDKIISLNEQVRPIRQPGGYYVDVKITQGLSVLRTQHVYKTKKKTSKKLKKMNFEDFQDFTSKLKAKRLGGLQLTQPNSFWPGHLLDKLQLYLPSVARDQGQAVFSCVHHKRHAYPAIYHPDRWWPLRGENYMTRAYYDAHKVYSLD